MRPRSESLSPKKTYKPPKLVVYGDLREMTLTSSNVGTLDGGKVIGMMKTV
jgi:hypothetical protein